MKTKWFIIPVIALSLGCTREIDTNVTYIDGEFTLYASSGENETKTVLQQDGSVFWSPEDCIKVFYGDVPGKFTSTNTEPAASAEFTGSLGSFVIDGETEFRAVYPYSDNTILGSDRNILSIYLPFEQTAVEGTFADDLFICVAKSKDVNLHFYNVCGGVKFSLARDDIKKVVFKGNNGEILAGRMAVEFNSDGLPQVTDFTAGQASVTLTAPDGGTFKAGAWYYLVLAPKALTKGYTMELWTDELAETISSESSVSVRRSSWGVLKELGDNSPMIVEGAVDLGLPSGLLWATCNIGATKPEEYGEYYAWGETEVKDNYEWSSYKWITDSSELTKYCDDPERGENGFADYKYTLDLDDDVANALLGALWRMPTIIEWRELLDNCVWESAEIDGIKGGLLSSKLNGNQLFLPFAGRRAYTGISNVGDAGYFWSSSLSSNIMARGVECDPNYIDEFGGSSMRRCTGYTIRPVYGAPTSVTSVSLNQTELTITILDVVKLIASINPQNAIIKTLHWSSSNEKVATVSEEGVVSALSAGTSIITVTSDDGAKTAECILTVVLPVPEIIDLGLPSGTQWASFNVGSTIPEEFGYYYAWGEIEPIGYVNQFFYSLNEYNLDWLDYKWCEGSSNSLTKYCNNSDYGHNGFVDNKIVLDPEDDAAHYHFGGKWGIPTTKEFEELISSDNCSSVLTTRNGINGLLITSKKNWNSIFIPLGGYRASGSLNYDNSRGWYWTSSLYTDEPSSANSFLCPGGGYTSRDYGILIRPVYRAPNETYVNVSNISLDVTELVIPVGESATLRYSISPENASDKRATWTSSNESIVTIAPGDAATGSCTVIGAAVGSAVITVKTNDEGKVATCFVTVKSLPHVTPDIVDLGLSVKWASFNLGATKPEENGYYYAWGETVPKADYSWATYKWCMGDFRTLTKYCDKSNYGYNGFTDGEAVLDLEDDASHVYLGGKWRMPTDVELTELIENCTWTLTTQNGVNGYQVIGSNGNYIFLPAAGMWYDTTHYGSDGYYWASSLGTDYPYHAGCIYFGSGKIRKGSGNRNYGYSIRPVYAESAIIPVESVSLDKTQQELFVGETSALVATVLPENATNRSLSWSSSDESIAIVSNDGIVKGVAAGTAVITVTTSDGGKTATCNVTVKESSSPSISIPEPVDLGLSVKWASFNLVRCNI